VAEAEELVTIKESSVVIAVREGTADMTVDVTFEAIWVQWEEGDEPCVSTDRIVISGTGPASTTTIEIQFDEASYETLEISGCNRSTDPTDEDDEASSFTGTISGGVITGTFFLFDVTAEREQ